MDEYAGRVLAERYRLPLRPLGDGDFGAEDFAETRAFDTYSGQEVVLRQVPLPEVVEAEFVDGGFAGPGHRGGGGNGSTGGADRSPREPAVRHALEAATAAAGLPDHPLLEQVFDVFAQDGSLWIVGERVAARPLAALVAARSLSPHRAAEIAADVLTALRALHAHGWIHRNITDRTVLICDDGRAILSGLAVGAAQEALCGYGWVPGEATAVDAPAVVAPAVDGPTVDAPVVDASAPEAAAVEASGSEVVAPEAVVLTKGGTGAIPAPRREPEQDDGPTPTLGSTPTPGPTPTLGSTPPPGPTPMPSPTTTHATAYGRPTPGLAAERARQARLNVIGPVTERWAPEQAGRADESGQLAAQAGPATDLWALGALLYRSVRGRPPYPEESAVELARLVCAQPPDSAEECGTLRPVVESLLRRDPADRPAFEELSDRLRTLIRTAPEPELGSRLVTMPALGGGTDPRRLPILRRRGELVRRGRLTNGRGRPRRAHRERPAEAQPMPQPPGLSASPPVAPAPPRQRPPKQPKPLRQPAPRPPKPLREPVVRRSRPAGAPRQQARGPRHLGRLLLGLILLLLVGAMAFAMLFLPKADEGAEAGRHGGAHTGTSDSAGPSGSAGVEPGGSPAPSPGQDGGQDGGGDGQDSGSAGTGAPRSSAPAKGFQVRKDPEGFRIAVRDGWQRRGTNQRGQVRYLGGDYELVIVPGRDTTARFGADPMAYQQKKEAELAPYRASDWSSASGLRRIDVGQTAMAEGTFTWRDSSGREVYVRNLAMIHNGRYHLVLVIGPDDGRREVDHLYEQATSSYRPN
ncbi:protein kinase family protein [Streptomyces halobius]|uniref:Protein kinase domain-containing protein n=1 Tax=Streptomyces halobius TaxID=2879846 RepID=A0ABY4MKR0_9ACTN|nr:hypothetical protein [Streptomyces halobius]UQA97927.1 hypothetical protein K9S39_25430 [Streptomyces halobius]